MLIRKPTMMILNRKVDLFNSLEKKTNSLYLLIHLSEAHSYIIIKCFLLKFWARYSWFK